MSVKLLVDIGNSCIKWAWLEEGRFIPGGRMPHLCTDRAAVFDAILGEKPHIDEAVVATVAEPDVNELFFRRIVQCGQGCKVRKLTSARTAGGVVSGYREPGSLGIDRWAAMLAAYKMVAGPVCVVDCGTAITVDGIGAEGRHLGGMIAPGLRLMRESLSAETAAIADGKVGTDSVWAANTQAAVTAGCLNAAAGMIDRLVARLGDDIKSDVTCLITGGDAERIRPLLNTACRLEADLVLQGVALLAEE